MTNPFNSNQWYQITSPRFQNRSMVGPRTNGLGGKTPVFFKLTQNTADGKLWQLFPTDNNTLILRTKAARTNAYLALQPWDGSKQTPKESEVIMRDVNGASEEVFWKINRFTNGGYNLENVANGTGWHLQAKDFENLTMTNDITERDNQKFQFTPHTDAGLINDPAFSSIKASFMLPSGATATVPGFSDSTASKRPTTDPAQNQSSSGGMSLGTKLGIGFGVAAAILLIVGALILVFFLRSRKRDRHTKAVELHHTELDTIPPYSARVPVSEVGAQKYQLRELPAHLPVQELDSRERRSDQKT